MTDADLNRIEAKLRITLPASYRKLMGTRAEELKGLTHEIRGKTYGWFDYLLFLSAKQVIDVNLAERKTISATEEAFPKWSKTFFLIGTNGAGDFYCLRLKGDQKVWMIGSDCGDKPSKMYDSLTQFVNVQVRRHKEEPLWQPPPVLSSFDGSCPLMERFRVFIGREACQIKAQEGDRPLTEKKLRSKGVDTEALRACVTQIITLLAKCETLTIKSQARPSRDGDLLLKYKEASITDARLLAAGVHTVGANVFGGHVYASLYGPQNTAPPPKESGIDWNAFRAAVARLLNVLHPPGTKVVISKDVKPGRFGPKPQGPWEYYFTYTLHEGK